MKRNGKNKKPWLMLSALALLLTSCAERLPVSGENLQPVKPAAFPQMPPAGRQPPVPGFCLPTCMSNLTDERRRSLNTLTPQPAPGESVSELTTQ